VQYARDNRRSSLSCDRLQHRIRCSCLAFEGNSEAQHRYVDGQLQRSKKPQRIRGLNQNHNHEMKKLFKSVRLHPFGQ
jgi:hypothetical protein